MNGQQLKPTLRFLFAAFFTITFISSCNRPNSHVTEETEENDDKHPFRTITRAEIKEFIPNGYAISADDIRITEKTEPLYTNLDNDSENEIVLILQSSQRKEGVRAIIRVLDFDNNSDKWKLLCEDTLKKEDVSKAFRITDLDKDGRNELHLMTYSIGLNYFDGSPVVLELSDKNNLVNLFPHSSSSEIGYVFDEATNNYYDVGYIWAQGETHWGCHYFKVNIYVFDGSTFTLKQNKITSNRYGLDAADAKMGGCSKYDVETILKELKLK